MKRIIFLLCLLGVTSVIFAQDYYWYRGEKIPLTQGDQHYILYIEDSIKTANDLNIIESGNVLNTRTGNFKWGISDSKNIDNSQGVVYQIPSFYSSDSNRDFYVTHRFFVKLNDAQDAAILQEYADKYQLEIEPDRDLPLWYIMKCGASSQYNALKLANIFYESGQFAVSEPEFSNIVQFDCVNDSLFYQQWNLRNTGQGFLWDNLVDINYCAAHAITSGSSSVIIGVYDTGVDLTHPDINLHSYSYDVNTSSSPSQLYVNNGIKYHGTACAGIIGAKTNNIIGVAGIAPECPIMSISFHNTTSENIKNGFIKAADKGCSVISNSWHLGAKTDYVLQGINYALTQGRNGKGCVIVFSAGNEDANSINYPANSNDSIIVVGASSPCGQRKTEYSCDYETWWGSNYGAKLDVMAPGVQIPTTDLVGIEGENSSNYMINFNGTSSACPHVAAVAGLILSVNPSLTQKEVADIIELTAQKVGPYSYDSIRPNGNWDEKMGYGLVDAYAAVMEAKARIPIQGPDYVCDTAKYYLLHPLQQGETVSWSVHNGMIASPSYSIIGATNQDTVTVVKTTMGTVIKNENTTDQESNTIDMLPPFPIDTKQKIKAIIHRSNYSDTCVKIFRNPINRGVPSVTSSNNAFTWMSGTSRTFTVTNCLTVPDSAFSWTFARSVNTNPHGGGTPTITTTTGTGRTITYTPIATTGICNLTITVSNTATECVNGDTTLYYRIGHKISMITGINDNVLDITIVEEGGERQPTLASLYANSTDKLELWHPIYGKMREIQAQRANETMNIAGLPSGTYALVLKENGDIIAQTKVFIP